MVREVGTRLERAMAGLEDAALLLMVVFLLPVAILLIGSPLMFVAWLVSTVARH